MEDIPAKDVQQRPIEQVDGADRLHDSLKFSFDSQYGEEDILYTLDEVFKDSGVKFKLLSRIRESSRSANHLCIVELSGAVGQLFTWPTMKPWNVDVFTDLKQIFSQ